MTQFPPLQEKLRDGLRRLAKAVVVITSRHEGTRFAMAATAVSELSLDPPSMLICVNQTASLHSPLAKGANFCINILSSTQREIAEACSGAVKGELRFALGEWGETSIGVPYLIHAQASFACTNETGLIHGTHQVFIGKVVEVMSEGPVDPLIYVDRQYLGLELEAPKT